MSGNLDLVRSIYAAWEHGDYSSAAWLDPTVEFEIADGPDVGSVTGISEARAAFREFLGMWDEFRTEAQSIASLMTSASSFTSTTVVGPKAAAWRSGG